MKLDIWLIVSIDEAVSVRKRTPRLGTLREGEVAIPVTLDIADSWFDARTNVVDLVVPHRELDDATGATGEPFAPILTEDDMYISPYALPPGADAQEAQP